MFLNDGDGESPRAKARFNPNGIQIIIVLGALALTAVGAFAAGYIAATGTATSSADLRLLRDVWNTVDREFYYPKPTDTERVYGAINGMLSTLNDPHTLFLPPVIAEHDAQVMRGEIGGVGAIVTTNEAQQFVVAEARLGWPAQQAGVQAGDIIVKVDDKDVTGLSLTDAVNLIRGPLGTQVTLTLKRPSQTEPVVVTLTRTQINVFGLMLQDNIGYISLGQFTATSPKDVEQQLKNLLEKKPRAIIFDLRDNGGGYLNESLDIADLFLTEGVIATEKTTHGENKTFPSKTGQIGESIPLVVLVNGNSASASEIVAGALKDRHRATLIGQRTYGKGSVQGIWQLEGGGQLRVTVGAWYTPNETPIQSVDGKPGGLVPDVEVTIPETPTPGVDPFRQAAIDYILKNY